MQRLFGRAQVLSTQLVLVLWKQVIQLSAALIWISTTQCWMAVLYKASNIQRLPTHRATKSTSQWSSSKSLKTTVAWPETTVACPTFSRNTIFCVSKSKWFPSQYSTDRIKAHVEIENVTGNAWYRLQQLRVELQCIIWPSTSPQSTQFTVEFKTSTTGRKFGVWRNYWTL